MPRCDRIVYLHHTERNAFVLQTDVIFAVDVPI
jgi:hypothetical protein